MVCRSCMTNYPKAAIPLSWRLTIVLSCPEHRLMLESVLLSALNVHWLSEEAEESPYLVHTLDSRICQALIEGYVELAGGKVLAADWFGLMQRIHEELSRPLYGEWSNSRLIQKIWTEADCCPQAGKETWKSFEHISLHRRRSMLIATAMDLIERGLITPVEVATMGKPDSVVNDLCRELGIAKRYIAERTGKNYSKRIRPPSLKSTFEI